MILEIIMSDTTFDVSKYRSTIVGSSKNNSK